MESAKKKKPNYPSKDEIIKALREGQELKGFENYILIIEHKKINENVGIVKGELLQNDEVILGGKMTVFPETLSNAFDWEKLNIGESIFNGFYLDYKGETLSEILLEGIKNSLREGKFPFIRR